MLIGYQAVYDTDWFDAFDYAKQNQFEYVSFDLNVPRFYIDSLGSAEIGRIREYAEKMGVGIAFHAPGDNISLFSDYPAIRNGILEHFAAIISAAERLGARHVVVHPGSYPSLKQVNKKTDDFSAEYSDYFSTVLYDNLSYLAERTKNVMLCVENFNFTPLTMGVVDRLLASNEKLYLTWDIAKTYDSNLQLNSAVESFMWDHSSRIREIHVHDMIQGFRSHQTIGDGGIEFQRYRDLLIRPDIATTIEVRPREAATVSKERLLIICERGNGSQCA